MRTIILLDVKSYNFFLATQSVAQAVKQEPIKLPITELTDPIGIFRKLNATLYPHTVTNGKAKRRITRRI